MQIDNLKRVNLLVGKNNCGKTSVLEALFLLTNPVNIQLLAKINAFRELVPSKTEESYWRSFFYNLDILNMPSLKAKTTQESRELQISPEVSDALVIEVSGHGKLSSPTSLLSGPTGSDSKASTILGLIYSIAIQNPERTTSFESSLRIDGVTGEFLASVNRYTERLRGTFQSPCLRRDGDIARFNALQINKAESNLVKVLRRIEPSLIDIVIGNDGFLCDIGLQQRLPMSLMGDGIRHVMSKILAISEASGGIAYIDEIENGLSKATQRILWEALIEAAIVFDVQLFATTHSLECADAFAGVFHGRDDASLCRIEKRGEEHFAVMYNIEELETTLENRWEFR